MDVMCEEGPSVHLQHGETANDRRTNDTPRSRLQRRGSGSRSRRCRTGPAGGRSRSALALAVGGGLVGIAGGCGTRERGRANTSVVLAVGGVVVLDGLGEGDVRALWRCQSETQIQMGLSCPREEQHTA